MDNSTSAFRRTGDIQMHSLVSALMYWHFGVSVTSLVYQLRNTWCCILGNCEHLFQSEPSCQIFLSLQRMVDFLRVKSSLSAYNDWTTGVFLPFLPPKSVPQTRRVHVYFPTTMRGLFSLLFSVGSCSSYSHGKGNSVFSLAFGKPLSEAFFEVSIPKLQLPLPTKNLLSGARCVDVFLLMSILKAIYWSIFIIL